MGAPLLSSTPGAPPVEVASAAEIVEEIVARRWTTRNRLSALRPPAEVSRPEEPEGLVEGPLAGYLGIDAGSVSTDLVLIDPEGDVKAAIYLPTRGRPAEVTLQGLSILGTRIGGRLDVLACGATGSARHLAGRLAGADVIKYEITCQLLGTSSLLIHGPVALRRAVDPWRVRSVVGPRVTRREEPG